MLFPNLTSKLLAPILIILVIIGFLAGYILFAKANPWNKNLYEVEIPAGYSVSEIGGKLEDAGIILSKLPFNIILAVTGWDGEIKSGKYKLSPSLTLWRIIRKLTRGESEIQEFRITFPEGTSVYKMARVLEKFGIPAYKEFEKLSAQEGYLFPDTYIVSKTISAEVIAERMKARFNEIVIPFWDKVKKDTKLNLHQILTLASIIEKEAQKEEERPIIASVFYNRLKEGMPLAADPTVKYALERPTKKVYLDQTKIDSPYNTYTRRGLPPGPICNPGLASIKAAIYPVQTAYFYFVAKKDGSHIFSRTWEEHQKARQKSPNESL